MKIIGIDMRIMGNSQGGIGRYVFELAKNLLLKDKSHKYLLFYNKNSAQEADLKELEKFPHAEPVPTPYRHYSLSEQTLFLRLLKRRRPDLMHFPNFNVPVLYKDPFVVTIHDMVHHKISGTKKSRLLHFWAYKQAIKAAARNSRAIITVSEYSKKDIASLLDVLPRKIEVIYEGPSLPVSVRQEEVEEVQKKFLLQKPYFLFVGVLERKKNIIGLVKGMDEFLRKYRRDVDLVLVGKADRHYPDIRQKALEIKQRQHLVFTNYVSDAELAALYKGAYAYITASLHEGFGLPGIEAMRFGLPLLASNTEVFNEIYDNAGIYFNPLDPKDIAEKMELLVKDTQFYDKLSQNSYQRGEMFSWDKAAEKTLGVYREVLNENGH